MKNLIKSFSSIVLFLSLLSCSNDNDLVIIEQQGVPTTIKGHVYDTIRGLNISDYKIVLVKSWLSCSNWMCGITSEEVATVYTDINGNYIIPFEYKLKAGQSYGLSEQYYGTPYYPEYYPRSKIVAGQTNILNIIAWKPVILQLNVEILNNDNPPLVVGNKIDESILSFLNTEFIYEQNVTKTINLRSKPDTDIKIIFSYHDSNDMRREKSFLFHTTIDDVDILDYTIDCSTF